MRTVFRRTMIATALAVSGLTAVGAAGAVAAPVGSSTYTNPVAGHPWGIYKGTADKLWSAYRHSTGTDRTLLGRIASRPRTRWYSAYIPASKIADKIRTDVAQEQHGNNNVQVWMALFRLWPHGESAAKQPLSSSDLAAYKTWMRNAARAIGSTRAVVVLEPDLAVALNGWHPAVRERLVRYAAHLLGALPNATVYLDGSSSDWLPAATSVKLLRASGIRYVHGFALGITHHPSTASEVGYGRSVSRFSRSPACPGNTSSSTPLTTVTLIPIGNSRPRIRTAARAIPLRAALASSAPACLWASRRPRT